MKQMLSPNTVYKMPVFDSKAVVHQLEYIQKDARLMAEAALVKRGNLCWINLKDPMKC